MSSKKSPSTLTTETKGYKEKGNIFDRFIKDLESKILKKYSDEIPPVPEIDIIKFLKEKNEKE